MVAGRSYVVSPPTIKKLAGAGFWLSDIKGGNSIKEMLFSLGGTDKAAHALSWLIQGDDGLFEDLSGGTLDEVVEALEIAYSLISTQSFLKLLGLAMNVANLTAKPKP